MIIVVKILASNEFVEMYNGNILVSNEFSEMYKAVKKNGSALEHQVSDKLKNNVVFALCISRIHSDTDDWVRKKYIYNFFFKESLKLFGFPMACFALYLIGISLPPVFLPFLSAIFVGGLFGGLAGGLVALIYLGYEIIHLYSTDPEIFSEFIDYLKECLDLKGKIHQYRLGYLLSRDLLNLGPIITVTTNLPKGVKEVSSSQYKGLTSLTHAVLPESVSKIGFQAFMNCTNLTTINVPESVSEIGFGAFRNCSSLTHFTIPKNVTVIHMDTFYGCTSLTHINIPNSVTHIWSGAFDGCTSLTHINIPNSVTHIVNGAFDGCTGLTHINIPNSVTHIGNNLFYLCTSLQVIAIDDSNAEDYQRILNLLPQAQQDLAMPWSVLTAAKDIKQQALVSVAALSMSGLTAHLLSRLFSYKIEKSQETMVLVDKASFFKRLNHARQPALASNPDVSRLTIVGSRFPRFAEQMLPGLCDVMAVRLNPTVAQIHFPVAPQELASLFGRVAGSLFVRVAGTALPQLNPSQSSAEENEDTSHQAQP